MESAKLNVFRASAGSGKTFELTAQYISLLLASEYIQPRHILAVTFTTKATMEMKTRILEHLYDIAHTDLRQQPDGFLGKVMKETGLPAEVLKRRAAVALHTILHHYDDFFVQTIDSFLQRLLHGLAHELGLTANFQVDINDKETIGRAVDRLMSELTDHQDLMHWMTRFALDNMEEHGSWDVVSKVKTLAEEINKEVFSRHSDSLAGKLTNDTLFAYRRRLIELRDKVAAEVKERVEHFISIAGDLSRFNNGKKSLGAYLNNVSNQTDPTDTYKKYIESSDAWLKSKTINNADLRREAEQLREALQALDAFRLSRKEILNSCNLSIKQLGELRLVGEINDMVTTLGEETGRFLLGRTPLLFDRLVGEDDTSFVYERAGVQFRHIMIDEFQDTSTLQWHTFQHLISEGLSSGYSSMLVGDVKQSIYRWRGGEWENLENIEQTYRPEQIVTNTLDTNYRSDYAIVDFNNDFFQKVVRHPLFLRSNSAQQQEAFEQIYSDVVQQSPSGKAEGYVRVSIGGKEWADVPTDDEEFEFDPVLGDLARQIAKLHDEYQVPYKEMAILVRGARDAARVINHMAAFHPDLPLVSNDSFEFNSSPAVHVVIATLRYLLHPSDTVALTYVIAYYYKWVQKQDIAWHDIATRREELIPQVLRDHTDQLKHLPLYERAERIIYLLELYRMEGQQDFLFFFLDSLKDFILKEGSDVHQFLDYWDETLSTKRIGGAVADGVLIQTIHTAKGLAYHTVFMPYLSWSIHEVSTLFKAKQMWCRPSEAPFSDLPLVPMTLSKDMQNSVYKEAYEEDMYRQRVENLNLLYVAQTSAIHHLYIWVDTAQGIDNSTKIATLFADTVLPEGENMPYVIEKGERVKPVVRVDSAPTEQLQTIEANPLRQPSVAIPLAHEESMSWRASFKQRTAALQFMNDEVSEEEQQRRTYIHRGKVLHHIFEHIATATDATRAVREAVVEGLLPAAEEEETLRLVGHRIQTGRAKSWFDGSWQLRRECTLLSRDGAGKLVRRRPDRVMWREGQIVVVDYKFGKPHDEHLTQVAEYMHLLQRMTGEEVQGYVWYVWQNEFREVPDEYREK